MAIALGAATAQVTPKSPVPFTTNEERCVIPAAQHHQVNFHVLRAILVVESGLKPNTVARNSNASIDVGMGGINSVHFAELARFGITPQDLLDACVSTYVAAWKLKQAMAKHGNTWYGVAAYHSTTPAYNARYQVLLQNELIRTGQLTGPIQKVPALSGSAQSAPSSTSHPPSGFDARIADSSTLVFDRAQP